MNPTSALVVIGNEILSGRTQDANIRYLAVHLGRIGAPLREVRVIPDIAETIVTTVTEMKARYDQVFTTGGIGPTHDDITSACIAEAFGVPLELHAGTVALMEAHYGKDEFSPARQRMAMLPRGATPITNAKSVAPGFSIGNVHVMAGVPSIMQAMFESVEPRLKHGESVESRTWYALNLYESVIAAPLEAVQKRWPDLDVGSYPFHRDDGRRGLALVVKGTDHRELAAAARAVRDLIAAAGAEPVEGEPPV
ncbi:competence/damage-inducible protein A [Acetobacter oeni]|uniref:Molybdenum cofactor biosynthesis protein n=1 Tax=Acetobacter oeni TaxID=304077 RepID=A0A511XNR9_9PROT|nr:molybdopterin-binding protein [Acetobacter oeni]MBB3881644.1 molybdenum cofactor synthesis domain-containing protein [Acetobacter oeni]NHO17548.1 competence/damage-inducible protein A [Acetobacter oeni]GBR01004.1 competence-damage protein [Acetobacter oeni LMG 21952]GEN64601.1 molybdenum cofactor biosynthesis protein [Acetobacter oeni]